MQKVIGNLISGFIFLIDRSIKLGDIIEIDNTFGIVQSLSVRYISLITRNGVEHLIPNENLITERVVNLSFSDKKIRQKVQLGVSDGTEDLDVPRQLIMGCR